MPDTIVRSKPTTGSLMAGKRGTGDGCGQRPLRRLGDRGRLRSAGGGAGLHLPGRRVGEAACAPLAEGVGSRLVLPCDVSSDASMDTAFEQLRSHWGELDFLVHSIGLGGTRHSCADGTWTPRGRRS